MEIALIRSYRTLGSCVVRGVFSLKDVSVIRSSALEVYQHVLGTKDPKIGANTLHLSDVARQQPAWMRDFVVWIIHRFAESEAFELYRRLYGDAIVFPLVKCIIRFQRTDHAASLLPFHQDAEVGKTAAHIVNCWTALDECGIDAPGIEVINAPLFEMRPDLFVYESVDKAGEAWREKLQLVMAEFGAFGTTRPVFASGDGCIFDHFALHRTYYSDAMRRPRMSVEIRAAEPKTHAKVYGRVDRVDAIVKGKRLSLAYHQ